MNKKILIIAKTLSQDSGGGRYARAVAEEYVRRGIHFEVLTEAGGEPEWYEDQCILPRSSLASFLKNVFIIRRKAKSFDIVHSFDGWPHAVYARLAILFTPKTLFVNAVGTYAIAALQSLVKRPFLASAYRKAKKIFPISKFVERNILKYIRLDNLEIAYLGTTPLRRPTEEELEAFKKNNGITNETPILLTVGALKERKGHLETVQAVSLLRKKYPNILYCIVGSQEGADAYIRKIDEYVSSNNLEKNIKLLPRIRSDAGLACMYELCTVFLLNSKYDEKSEHLEGFGLVLLEAAHFGKPVIGSRRNSGIPEAMEDGYNGYLVDEVRAENIAEAVEKVLSNYGTLSQHSVEVAKKFTWERTASSYIHAYGEKTS